MPQQLSRTRPVYDEADLLPTGRSDAGARLAMVARVVGAARTELCQRQHLSLRAVARRAGVDLREIAQYVGSGDELIRRIFFEMAVDAHETMAAVAPASAAGSCRDRLLAYARGYRHWAQTHPVEFSLLLGPAAKSLMNESVAAQGVTWFYRPLLDILRDGLDGGQVDTGGVARGRALPALQPSLLAAAQDLNPRLVLAFATLNAGMHGFLVMESCGQVGAVFVDADRAYDHHVRALIDAAGIA